MTRALLAALLLLLGSLSAALPQAGYPVSGGLKSKIISSTRDLTTASGSQALTGFGFQPTTCFATGGSGASATTYSTIFGMVDSSRTAAIAATGSSAGIQYSANLMVFMDATGNNFQTAGVASYDADGLTLTWTKTASPTGTVTFAIMCYR